MRASDAASITLPVTFLAKRIKDDFRKSMLPSSSVATGWSHHQRRPARCMARSAVLEPGVLRTVDLYQLAQALAPPTRLMRGGESVATILPQPIRDHPAAQRSHAKPSSRGCAASFSAASVGPKSAYRSRTIDSARLRTSAGSRGIARLATALRQQTRGTVPTEAVQQAKYLAPPQANQHARIADAQTTGLPPRSSTSRRLNSCLLIDTTAMAHLPATPRTQRERHLYFAEGCHLYIAATPTKRPTHRALASVVGRS